MVQFDILTGTKEGSQWIARSFPFCLGRSPHSALVLEDQGVWDRHANFASRSGEGVIVSAAADALLVVNGQHVRQAVLKSGDLLDIGSVKMRFGLSAAKQSSLVVREVLTWFALGALCLIQVALIYWLSE